MNIGYSFVLLSRRWWGRRQGDWALWLCFSSAKGRRSHGDWVPRSLIQPVGDSLPLAILSRPWV